MNAEELFATLPYFDPSYLVRTYAVVASRDHPWGNASLSIWRACSEQCVQRNFDAGVDPKVPQLLLDYMKRAIEFWPEDDDLSELCEAVRLQGD